MASKSVLKNKNRRPNRAVISLVLLIGAVLSAIAVVTSVHTNRLLFAELQRLRQSADASRIEWGKLLLEQSSYGAFSRIERLAYRKLLMKTPESDEVVMVGNE